MAELAESLHVTVRYFAAAHAAAGWDAEQLSIRPGATVAELVDQLSSRNNRLAHVLCRCSFLCDGMAVRNHAEPLRTDTTIDVLPPFSGG